jgi:hypothetical protein
MEQQHRSDANKPDDSNSTRRLSRSVFLIPLVLSLVLSLSTVGIHPFWQDSGLYLTAVKETGVLYPPGFVLYEILCRAWTLLLFFVDFTLAVHLFSALCAALAAGIMALATRDMLRSRGAIFKVSSEEPGTRAELCGILAGVLMAGGFTFWSTAIYAKGYSFYYLVLTVLLWRMIRADESRRPRDFTIVAVLIGLAWQAHPSSILIGGALVLFVGVHARFLGWKGILGRTAVAAAFALGPSLLVLPVLMARDPWVSFGQVRNLRELLQYATGTRYVGMHGAFGFDSTRGASFGRYMWEDLLGVGMLLTAAGLVALARRNRRLLAGLLAWVVPYSLITILFKTEVQHDCWLVAARLPLSLALGVGACSLAIRAGARAPVWIAAAGVAATSWAAWANVPDVSQRNYLLAEIYGRTLIESVDRDAIVILSGDDSNGLASYLQRVRGERPDVTLITSSFLNSKATTGSDWYEAGLLKRSPFLTPPDYEELRRRFPDVEVKHVATAAFINANAGGPRAIFCEFLVTPGLVRPDMMLAPAGVHFKVVPRASKLPVDLRYWKFPIEPEQVRPLYRRAHGQDSFTSSAGMTVTPAVYERRLAAMLLRARFHLALALTEQGQFAPAARLCQSIIDYDDEEFEKNPEIIHLLGISYYAAGQPEKAVPALRRSSEISIRKENRATAIFYLGDIARKSGDEAAARRYFEQALGIPGLDPAYVREMELQHKLRNGR